VPATLAQAEGRAREASGAERALVQALDGFGIARHFGTDDEGQFGHG
jgi:hypothetical protein